MRNLFVIVIAGFLITIGAWAAVPNAVDLYYQQLITGQKLHSALLEKQIEVLKKIHDDHVEDSFAMSSPVLGGGFGITSCGLSVATSTVTYQAAGVASTTFVSTVNCDASRAESMDLNIIARATTTATLQWELQFSNNNIDWYGESCNSVDSINTKTHGLCMNKLALQNSQASTSVNVTITPTASRFMRIRFGAVTGNLVFSAERTQKEPFLR